MMKHPFQLRSKLFSYFVFDYPRSGLKRIIPPLFLGFLLSLAFQPSGYTFLGFLSPLLFYRAFEKRLFYIQPQFSRFDQHVSAQEPTDIKGKDAFFMGYWYGMGYFTGGLYWIAYALHIDWIKYALLIPLAALGIPAILSIGLGLATLIASKLRFQGRLLPLLGFVLSWTLFEWFKGHFLTGFPWLNLAEIWLSGNTIIQNLAFVGPYGLGLLTLVLFVLLYCVLFFSKKHRPKYLVAFFALSFGLLINGQLHLSKGDRSFNSDFDLVLVQPNILQINKWKPDRLRFNIDTHMRLSKQGRLQPQLGVNYKPKVFIWPEASVPYQLESHSPFTKYLTQILEEGDYLILGALRKNNETGTSHNSLFVLDHEGGIIETYDKAHLVPFGEYIPYRNLIPFDVERLAAGAMDYDSGPGIRTLKISTLPSFSPLICYEAIFTGEVIKEDSKDRPKWMLNLTNDGWYLGSAGIYQHLELTRMRAIEEGIPLVRVVYRGVSAVFDANGRMTAQIPFDQAEALVTQLPKVLEERTIYSMYGNMIYFLMLCFLMLIMICLYLYNLKKRKEIAP